MTTLLAVAPGASTGYDELAVAQVATDGMRMRLTGTDRDEAVRRMHGRIDPEIIGWRLYVTSRTVLRIAHRLHLTASRTKAAA